MVKVKLWGSLRDLADGQDIVEVDASNFKQLLDQLETKYPALGPHRDAWFTKISEDNEVVLMPYMVGG